MKTQCYVVMAETKNAVNPQPQPRSIKLNTQIITNYTDKTIKKNPSYTAPRDIAGITKPLYKGHKEYTKSTAVAHGTFCSSHSKTRYLTLAQMTKPATQI